MIPLTLNPNSEIETEGGTAFRGAHASGVWFSASRRKPRPSNVSVREIPKSVCDDSSGATPEPTRETRVLPIPTSEFGLNHNRSLILWSREIMIKMKSKI